MKGCYKKKHIEGHLLRRRRCTSPYIIWRPGKIINRTCEAAHIEAQVAIINTLISKLQLALG